MDKLERIFSQAHYYVEKIYDGLKGGDEGPFVKIGIEMLNKEILGKFESKLKERGLSIHTYDSIKYIYDVLEYPLNELKGYYELLEKNQKPNISQKAAYIFQFFIREHIKELEQIAKEIDVNQGEHGG